MQNIPLPDSKLTTREELLERLATIRRNRDALESKPLKDNGIATFKARHVALSKLTEREGAICGRLSEIKRAGL
jgi:hypothetical protein